MDFDRPKIIYDLAAQGTINLDGANVTVKTPFFKELFVGTGKISLKNQLVTVENIDGIFAEKDLNIQGKFPLLSALPNLDNPLKINLPPGKIKINKLYQGGVEGEVIVKGTSLTPEIGGAVTLADGKVFIPQVETPSEEDVIQFTESQLKKAVSGPSSGQKISAKSSQKKKQSAIEATLNNFQVNLAQVKLQQAPIYEFQLDGDLVLNGSINEPRKIKPKGKLLLTKAKVDVFSSSFNLARNRENKIVFTPKAGIFNPKLDLMLRTQVEDIDEQQASRLRFAESNSNEIDDPLSEINDSQTVRISLVVDGETQEILPNLAQAITYNCTVHSSNQSLVTNKIYYSAAELEQFTQCFRDATNIGVNNRNLINSPAVQLTSVPSLNRGEIINLLSGQFIAFADQITNSSQSQLFDLGVNRFVLSPLQSSLFYSVEDTTVRYGKKLGLDYLTVFPNLEGTYNIDQNSSVRSIYNYILNEARVEYQRSF